MHTPNELRDIQFSKAVFGGYDAAAVDEMMTSIVSDYSALFKENAVLKNKLKLLADTVEEYRSVDEAMRKALITAQNMANEMVNNAEKKSKEMVETARNEANTQIENLTARIKAEKQQLKDAKRETASFISDVMKMYERQGKLLLQLNEKLNTEDEAADEQPEAPPDADNNAYALKNQSDVTANNSDSAIPDTAEMLIKKIQMEIEEKSASELNNADFDKEPTLITDPPKRVAKFEDNTVSDESEDDQSTQRFDLSDLKFGKNYDFSQE